MPTDSQIVEGGCYRLSGQPTPNVPGQHGPNASRKWKAIALAIAVVIVAAVFVYLVR